MLLNTTFIVVQSMFCFKPVGYYASSLYKGMLNLRLLVLLTAFISSCVTQTRKPCHGDRVIWIGACRNSSTIIPISL